MNIDQEKFIKTMKVADKQIAKLQIYVGKLKEVFPLDVKKLEQIESDDIIMSFIETMMSKFSKAQDYIGGKVFYLLLKQLAEDVQGQSFIDRLNKLEKLGFIKDSYFWRDLRQLRNNISHEYPDDGQITVKYLNQTHDSSTDLIKYWQDLKIAIPKRCDIKINYGA